jgi:hypothetical protein
VPRRGTENKPPRSAFPKVHPMHMEVSAEQFVVDAKLILPLERMAYDVENMLKIGAEFRRDKGGTKIIIACLQGSRPVEPLRQILEELKHEENKFWPSPSL